MECEIFLTKWQKMYTIFEEEGETMEEDAKTRFLFRRVNNSDLQKSIEALKYQMPTNPSGKVSYTISAIILSTYVSKFARIRIQEQECERCQYRRWVPRQYLKIWRNN